MTARAREASPARYFWPAGPAGAPRPGLLRECASASDCEKLRELLHGAWPHANGGWDVVDGAATAAAAGTCGGQLVPVALGRWGRRRLGRGGCKSRRSRGAPSPVIARAGARFAECKRMGGREGIMALLRELHASGSLGAECPGLGSDAPPPSAPPVARPGAAAARRAPIAHPGRGRAFSGTGDSIAAGRRAGFPLPRPTERARLARTRRALHTRRPSSLI